MTSQIKMGLPNQTYVCALGVLVLLLLEGSWQWGPASNVVWVLELNLDGKIIIN